MVEHDHIGRIVNIRTQISCPFRCSFCSYPTTQGPVIKADVDMFEKELETLARRGVERLMIVDDTFNVPLPRFKDLCRMMIRNRFDITWTSYFRCSNADEETFDLIREAGCVAVFAGIESGDPQGKTNDLVGWDVPDVEATAAALREKGVVFEEYDYPSLKTVEGVATIGSMQAAWFKDPDGNLLALVSG